MTESICKIFKDVSQLIWSMLMSSSLCDILNIVLSNALLCSSLRHTTVSPNSRLGKGRNEVVCVKTSLPWNTYTSPKETHLSEEYVTIQLSNQVRASRLILTFLISKVFLFKKGIALSRLSWSPGMHTLEWTSETTALPSSLFCVQFACGECPS